MDISHTEGSIHGRSRDSTTQTMRREATAGRQAGPFQSPAQPARVRWKGSHPPLCDGFLVWLFRIDISCSTLLLSLLFSWRDTVPDNPSVHYDFIHEEPGKYGRVAVCLIADIAGLYVADCIEILEQQIRVRCRNVIETLTCRGEIPPII